jgi:hypothetical protein
MTLAIASLPFLVDMIDMTTVEIDLVLDKQMAAGFVASDRSHPRSDEDGNISLDFGFIAQHSSDTSRIKRLQGLNGETCYCLLIDHFSGTLYGETFCSKAPPIDFLNRWLVRHGLPVPVADIAKIAERLQNATPLPPLTLLCLLLNAVPPSMIVVFPCTFACMIFVVFALCSR